MSYRENAQDCERRFAFQNAKVITNVVGWIFQDFVLFLIELSRIINPYKYKKKVSVSGVREQYAVCSDEKGNRCKSCTNSSL